MPMPTNIIKQKALVVVDENPAPVGIQRVDEPARVAGDVHKEGARRFLVRPGGEYVPDNVGVPVADEHVLSGQVQPLDGVAVVRLGNGVNQPLPILGQVGVFHRQELLPAAPAVPYS